MPHPVRPFALALAALPALALAARPARAQGAPSYTNCATVVGNLVQNCGFEAGLNGYTLTFTNGGGFASPFTDPSNAHSGTTLFYFGDPPPAARRWRRR